MIVLFEIFLHNFNNIRYADDIVLTANIEMKLQELLEKLVQGGTLKEDGKYDTEIQKRIWIEKDAFQNLRNEIENFH